MKNHPQSLQVFLDQSFARFRKLPQNEVAPACERVLDRLREEMNRAPGVVRSVSPGVRRPWNWRRIAVAGAAAAVLAGVFTQMRTRQDSTGVVDARAVVETADRTVNRLNEG